MKMGVLWTLYIVCLFVCLFQAELMRRGYHGLSLLFIYLFVYLFVFLFVCLFVCSRLS